MEDKFAIDWSGRKKYHTLVDATARQHYVMNCVFDTTLISVTNRNKIWILKADLDGTGDGLTVPTPAIMCRFK